MLIPLIIPLNFDNIISEVEAQDICCDAQDLNLFMVDNTHLSPFEHDLAEETKKNLTSSPANEQTIETWTLNSNYPGNYPSSSWEFVIYYDVSS